MTPGNAGEHGAHTCQKTRTVLGVVPAPETVGVVPASARQFGGAIDAVPVWGIVTRKVLKTPRDAHFAKHGEISRGVGLVGVEERAVPVEEHALNGAV